MSPIKHILFRVDAYEKIGSGEGRHPREKIRSGAIIAIVLMDLQGFMS